MWSDTPFPPLDVNYSIEEQKSDAVIYHHGEKVLLPGRRVSFLDPGLGFETGSGTGLYLKPPKAFAAAGLNLLTQEQSGGTKRQIKIIVWNANKLPVHIPRYQALAVVSKKIFFFSPSGSFVSFITGVSVPNRDATRIALHSLEREGTG